MPTHHQKNKLSLVTVGSFHCPGCNNRFSYGRGIPDLAWNAAGLIYTDGTWGIEGGTSVSVP
ncbi:hypothetical protein [Shewanella surugensis]|uniref:Uncharacterized protein n=1 Tax=Shewanella surugensis TaxID=212020 RepID=A0ABT0LFX5_9GAMM|nr:hypothetical protein [Shewanella surugensis]MCL1126611.1 hypothetical protein [Shewanella surugensis]